MWLAISASSLLLSILVSVWVRVTMASRHEVIEACGRPDLAARSRALMDSHLQWSIFWGASSAGWLIWNLLFA